MAIPRFQRQVLEKLLESKRLTAATLAEMLLKAEDKNLAEMEKILAEDYKLSSFALLCARADARGQTPYIASRHRVTADTFKLLDLDFCVSSRILPVASTDEYIFVAVSVNFDPGVINRITEITNRKVHLYMAQDSEIMEKVKKDQQAAGAEAMGGVMAKLDAQFGDIGNLAEAASKEKAEEEGPIIELVNRVIEEAYHAGASDIHLDPQEKELLIRYRVDGLLSIRHRLPRAVAGALTARIKIMCDLDISERRLPQDGRIVFKKYTKRGLDVDLRVSTAPLNHGEGIVMRILDKQKTTLPLPQLGFTDENLAKYRECIRQPYGMILHCGPTGSGKSMTLYSALNEVNTEDVCIRTAEDPIEYTLPGLNQMQMQKAIGLTFASALRSFLRQDPDIILVGEIRDKETANIAVEAALTGHMLISTLHTNDAPSTIARLVDMGIEPFMISSSLVCVCAQRLMRRVCKKCKIPYVPEGSEKAVMERAIGWSGQIYKANPKGCPACGGGGYKGRVGIHELMINNEELIAAVNKGSETAVLKAISMRNGMKTLHQDSVTKVRMGLTTMNEALSTVTADMELMEKKGGDAPPATSH